MAELKNLPLYKMNRLRASQLEPNWKLYYYYCQGYFLTEVEPSRLVDETMADLLNQLEEANQRRIPPEEAIGQSAYHWSREKMRQKPMRRYTDHISVYIRDLLFYLLLTYCFYSIYLFSFGLGTYRSLNLAINMPLPISLLGVPLQILLILTAVFCYLKFVRRSACGRRWHAGANVLYLIAFILLGLLAIGVPAFSVHYRLFIWEVPVIFLWLIVLFFYLYRLGSKHLHLARRIDRWFDNYVARVNRREKEPRAFIQRFKNLGGKRKQKKPKLKLKRPITRKQKPADNPNHMPVETKRINNCASAIREE